MNCVTVKQGKDCPFMASKGCSFNGGICHEVVEQCDGCNRNIQFNSSWYCMACPDPTVKWKSGRCNLASHVTATAAPTSQKKVNPLKASKRGNK